MPVPALANTVTFLVQAPMLSSLDGLESVLLHQLGTNPMSPSSVLPWRTASRTTCLKHRHSQRFSHRSPMAPFAFAVILNGKQSLQASAPAPSCPQPPHWAVLQSRLTSVLVTHTWGLLASPHLWPAEPSSCLSTWQNAAHLY